MADPAKAKARQRRYRAKKQGIPVDQLPVGRGSNPRSWGHHRTGAEHHRWNDGRMLNEDGYVKLRVGKEHPLADPNGYAYEHLLVWVSAGNPKPPRGFTLHHKDEVKANNRLSNLELLRRADHGRHHIAERERDPKTGRLRPKSAAVEVQP
ncbi:MAG: hypothetical protein JWQ97_3386 [Phenylobacterium sp.]|nr:hypothetical protein [Phenylobacterium sp.]